MSLLYYLINYLVLGWFLFVIAYYRDISQGKEYYTHEEIFSYNRIIKDQFHSLRKGMPLGLAVFLFVAASILGGWMPLWGNIFGSNDNNWFFNSSAPFLILYFIIPSVFGYDLREDMNAQGNFAQESKAKGWNEAIRDILPEHYNLLVVGFGLGYTAYLTFNWGMYQAHPFFWNIANGALIFWFCMDGLKNTDRFQSYREQNPSYQATPGPQQESKKKKKASKSTELPSPETEERPNS